MKSKRILICAVSIICSLLLAFSTILAVADEGVPDGFSTWDEYFNSLIYSETEKEITVPPYEEMEKIAENNAFSLLYHADGYDFYIKSKQSDKVWSSAIHPDYMDLSKKTADTYSSILELTVVDESGAIRTLSLTDVNSSDFSVTKSDRENGLVLSVSLTADLISFNVEITLEKDGVSVTVPADSLKEDGTSKLLSIHMLPSFGATKVGEKGYVFYPDGSGALVPIRAYAATTPQSYSYPLYGMSTPDFTEYESKKEQNIQNLMLPVFGVKQGTGGFLAAITAGDTNANFNMSVSDCHKQWFQFDYRMYTSAEFNYTGTAFGGGTVSKLLPKLIEGDRGVRFFLLEGEKSTYSDMARAYRKFLEDEEKITRLEEKKEIPLSLEFFMAATSSGMLGDTLQVMTTYEQTKDMLSDLKSEGVKSMDALLVGWSSGGYEQKPTTAGFESSLGGVSGYKKLYSYAEDEAININLAADYLIGDSSKGSFNKKKDVLRNLLGAAMTDKDETKFFMNPSLTIKESVEKLSSKKNINLCLDGVGELVLPSLYEKAPVSRTETANAYKSVLEKLSKSQKTVSVTGGNYYVLPYANRLYDVADTDSAYYQNEQTVPFYQMVMHGYVEYSSVAGNLSENLQLQKLKWVETGSLPHFVLTNESPSKLKNTGYNEMFSSEYNLWKDKMTAVYKEFNSKLSAVYNSVMTDHSMLKADLVRVTYEDGSRVYINYGEKAQSADGVTVPAMDYIVIGGK